MRQARRLLKVREVRDRTGLSHAAVYDMAKRGDFPKPIKLSPRCARWVEEEVESFIKARVKERDLELDHKTLGARSA